MLFQVIRSYDNKPMLRTEYESCIPYDDLESLDRAGYKFRLDGKIVSYKFMMNRRNLAVATGGSVDPLKLTSDSAELTASAPAHKDSNASPVMSTDTDENVVHGVQCIETGVVYRTQAEAARNLNIDPAQVSDSIKTGRKRSGYTFKRV